MPTLLGVGLERGEEAREVIGPARVEARLGTAAAVVVLTDEDVGVFEDHLVSGGRLYLERHIGKEIALVVAVEVDLEHAPDMWLVVRMIIEVHAVDLDGAIVPRRPTGLRARLRRDGRDETDGSDQHADEASECAPLPAVVNLLLHHADFPSATGRHCPAVARRRRGRGGRPDSA
jgi:hypothetical protein